MSPCSTFVVYNTLVRLFEGAKPAGQVALEGKNLLYLYARAQSPIAAAWSFDWANKPRTLRIAGGVGKLQVLDIMGNPSDAVKREGRDLVLELTNSPLCILPTPGAEAQFGVLMRAARVARAGA